MNTMREAIHEYVELRCSLGFKMVHVEQTLLQFATFLEERRATYITQELALAWAQKRVRTCRWSARGENHAVRPWLNPPVPCSKPGCANHRREIMMCCFPASAGSD